MRYKKGDLVWVEQVSLNNKTKIAEIKKRPALIIKALSRSNNYLVIPFRSKGTRKNWYMSFIPNSDLTKNKKMNFMRFDDIFTIKDFQAIEKCDWQFKDKETKDKHMEETLKRLFSMLGGNYET